jgi:hypothetical protein
MTEPADSAALWNDLEELFRNVVEEMNRLEEFRNKTGGLDYQLGETDLVIVTRQSLPNMSITISGRAGVLRLECRILARDKEPVESRESLAIEIDESGPAFHTEAGEVLTVEEAVYYVLRPFLHLNSVAVPFSAKR